MGLSSYDVLLGTPIVYKIRSRSKKFFLQAVKMSRVVQYNSYQKLDQRHVTTKHSLIDTICLSGMQLDMVIPVSFR